jgi:hypothetical protein
VVDTLPVGTVPDRGMIDFHSLEAEKSIESMLAMDWERLIPGHPGAPNGRLGTKEDVRAQLPFLRDASAAVKVAACEGKCWEPAEREVKLPQYESWPGYTAGLPLLLHRYCGLWGRGTRASARATTNPTSAGFLWYSSGTVSEPLCRKGELAPFHMSDSCLLVACAGENFRVIVQT